MKRIKAVLHTILPALLLAGLSQPLLAQDEGFEGNGVVESVDSARRTVTVDGVVYSIPVDLQAVVLERNAEAPAFAVIKPGANIGWLGEGGPRNPRLVSVIVYELKTNYD